MTTTSTSGKPRSSHAKADSGRTLDWAELRTAAEGCKPFEEDGFRDEDSWLANGPANARSTLRLFGREESEVRVTLFHDFHRWCPYCQKVWIWLEAKRIPYRTKRVTMFCYGEKEAWYKRVVPSGMLPALELDGKIITESDVILLELEREFGPLGPSMSEPSSIRLRQLERKLFSAWCGWLCYNLAPSAEKRAQEVFEAVAAEVGAALREHNGPFFLGPTLTCIDVVFIPYVERMNASLFYYKGYNLRGKVPELGRWLDALEKLDEYKGTQSDHHTHAHDLPPQMGGCYSNESPDARRAAALVDLGCAKDIPDTALPEPANAAIFALSRVVKHREAIIAANPHHDKAAVDASLRAALTLLLTGAPPEDVPRDADAILRYARDRISVPRDMPLWPARRLREAFEATASRAGDRQGPPIPLRHRRDQDPRAFGRT